MAATAAVPAQRCLLALLIITLSMLLPMSASAQSSSTANYTVPNVVQALNASGNFSIFLSIAAKANITSALQAFISSANTSGATAFVPLDSAFTPEIVSAYASLSTANQANLLLYHVLPRYYNRSQVVTLSNVATLAAVLNNSTTGYRLSAVNQSGSNDGVITVYASVNAANVSSANISGIPNPPSFPIAIYPIRSVLLPVEIFGSTSNSSSPSPSPSPSSSAGPSSSKSPSPTPSPSTSNKSAPSPSPSAAAPISSSSSSFHYLISMTTLLLMFAISNLF
jgi:hypothetical protein